MKEEEGSSPLRVFVCFPERDWARLSCLSLFFSRPDQLAVPIHKVSHNRNYRLLTARRLKVTPTNCEPAAPAKPSYHSTLFLLHLTPFLPANTSSVSTCPGVILDCAREKIGLLGRGPRGSDFGGGPLLRRSGGVWCEEAEEGKVMMDEVEMSREEVLEVWDDEGEKEDEGGDEEKEGSMRDSNDAYSSGSYTCPVHGSSSSSYPSFPELVSETVEASEYERIRGAGGRANQSSSSPRSLHALHSLEGKRTG